MEPPESDTLIDAVLASDLDKEKQLSVINAIRLFSRAQHHATTLQRALCCIISDLQEKHPGKAVVIPLSKSSLETVESRIAVDQPVITLAGTPTGAEISLAWNPR